MSRYVVICLREETFEDESAGVKYACCAPLKERFVHGVYGPFTSQREAKRQIKSMKCDGRIHSIVECDLRFYEVVG